MLDKSVERYSKVAILLHWVIAGALAVTIAIGFAMPGDATGFALFQFHKSLGITILVLTVLRIGWRLTHRAPPAVDRGFNGFLAGAVHFLLYAFMLGAPLTGWAVASTSSLNIPTVLFGVVPLPHLPLPQAINHRLEDAHELIAYLGLALFALHVAGALKHHLLVRDRVLRRMSPSGSGAAGMGLLGAVLLAGGGTFGVVLATSAHDDAAAGDAVEAAPVESVVAADAAELPATEEELAVDEAAEEATEDALVDAGPPAEWTIQPGGSLRFVADNGGSAMNGSFRRWSGTIAMNPDNPAGSRIAIEIDLASATLGDATQDQMLASGDFFGVAANPTATFRSSDVQKTGTNSYRANGTLAIRGASRPQSITFTLSGSGVRRSVSGSGTVDRTAFGVGTGDSAAGLAPTVTVEFAFDATS